MSKRSLDLSEFIDLGLLQEINRRLLHPMGFALSVMKRDLGGPQKWEFCEVWDCREDPEGLTYAPSVLDNDEAREKKAMVDSLLKSKQAVRRARLGFVVQPIPLDPSEHDA